MFVWCGAINSFCKSSVLIPWNSRTLFCLKARWFGEGALRKMIHLKNKYTKKQTDKQIGLLSTPLLPYENPLQGSQHPMLELGAHCFEAGAQTGQGWVQWWCWKILGICNVNKSKITGAKVSGWEVLWVQDADNSDPYRSWREKTCLYAAQFSATPLHHIKEMEWTRK